MKKWLVAVLFGTLLVLGACGGGDDASDEPADSGDTEESSDGATVDAGAAEDVYKSSCAGCHGADLSGGAGPDLTAVGSSLSSDEIADVIENGAGSMPGGLVSGDDVTLLSDWLADHK